MTNYYFNPVLSYMYNVHSLRMKINNSLDKKNGLKCIKQEFRKVPHAFLEGKKQ